MKFKTSDLIKNVPQPLPKGHLLKSAQVYMDKLHGWRYPLEELKDEHGTFAWRYKNGVLVARRKPLYDIVSVHRKVLGTALTHALYIYIHLNGVMYRADPVEIVEKRIKSNQKGQASMINFNVKILKRLNND